MKGFKNRTSKVGSLVSLIVLSAMIILFAAHFPVFMGSDVGRIFAGIWIGFSVIMFVSHTVRLLGERRQRVEKMYHGFKDVRTRKNVQQVRAMRG